MLKIKNKNVCSPKHGFAKFELIFKNFPYTDRNKRPMYDLDAFSFFDQSHIIEDVRSICNGKFKLEGARPKDVILSRDIKYHDTKYEKKYLKQLWCTQFKRSPLYKRLYLELEEDLLMISLVHRAEFSKCYRLITQ